MTSIKETSSEVETSECGCVGACGELCGMPALLPPQTMVVDYEQPETWSMRNGFKISDSIPLNWEWSERNSNRGPSHCETCRRDGMFEDVFYGLCIKCCAISEPCPCVFCRMAKKDEHKRMERRTNICNFIKTIQLVVNDLRREYPADEYGIVKEAIDSGFCILNLHANRQYEQMMNDACLPTEVAQLSNRELMWRLNSKMDIPISVREAALKAADRMKKDKETPVVEDPKQYYKICTRMPMGIIGLHCMNEVRDARKEIDARNYAQKEENETTSGESDPTQYNTCENCSTWMWNHSGDMCDKCIESHMQDVDEYDIQCKECRNWVSTKEIDARNYCLDCQNPEYDPVWPMGD